MSFKCKLDDFLINNNQLLPILSFYLPLDSTLVSHLLDIGIELIVFWEEA